MVNNAGLSTFFHTGKTKMQYLIAFLRSIPESGLWPYTPDPAGPGLYSFGEPDPTRSLWIAGNSRHELKRLDRDLTPVGMPVLAIDTGGLDLDLALAAGRLTVEMISGALKTVAEEETIGEIPPVTRCQFLLAYPIWAALYRETPRSQTPDPKSLALDPGPANARDLPAFLARGRELTWEMKVRSIPLRNRLSIVMAHAGLFLLIAALPMVLIGVWRGCWPLVPF